MIETAVTGDMSERIVQYLIGARIPPIAMGEIEADLRHEPAGPEGDQLEEDRILIAPKNDHQTDQ